MNKKLRFILGPLLFAFAFIPYGGLALNIRLAFGTLAWMGFWWVTLPVSPAITAFIPVGVNAVFNITKMSNITGSFSAELIFLLAGANIITMAWEATGVDKRIAARALSVVGTSVRQQVVIWLLLATCLSAFLPNTVVAAVLCSIAMSMLKYVGEGDVKHSSAASLIMLAIVWGANNGGMFTPLGGAMNLVTISYIEELIGGEFIYSDWVVRMLPFGLLVTLVSLVFLLRFKTDKKSLNGSKDYFQSICRSFGKLSGAGKASLSLFIIATALSFTRQLYQNWLPGLKPGYIFMICGGLVFLLKDENGKSVVSWKTAEQNMMWGLFFLFAGGTALGALVNGSGAAEVIAELFAKIIFSNTFLLVFIIVSLNVVLSDIVNNTACAAVMIPIIISVVKGLGLPVMPYLWVATVSYNLSFTLPTSIRAIPIGYGLEPAYMFRRGLAVSVAMILAVSVLGWLCIEYWPAFATLTQ
ncbi:MAG: SLC13 family permease [Oscillospiraceae bacterium]|nr:SLC13 family permease [Oscillospiraceae bacterium]